MLMPVIYGPLHWPPNVRLTDLTYQDLIYRQARFTLLDV